jgi:hypothetical protein
VGDFAFGGFCWLLLRGSQFEDKSCTCLAVIEATFLMVDSRKSIDAGKNETSPTTENNTIDNQIIDRAVIRDLLYCFGAVGLLHWSIAPTK